jgi:NAD(P)-dependent dehydrogenase (short-subunit alcohol dehydrogenase family)
MEFQDAVVMITGAGGGMGREIAKSFAKQGARLALCDASPKVLDVTVQELRELVPQVQVTSGIVDVRDVQSIRGWVGEVKEKLGYVSALVNCAGVWHMAEAQDVTEQDWNFVVDINLKGTFFFCQAVLEQMREAGKGSIVNIASAAGEYGSIRPASHYAASKGGIIAMSKSLAREGAPSVRVNVVSPGPIDTPMLAATEDEKREVGKRPLVGRLGTPNDIAAAVLYLSGPNAGYVTGEVLRVNGGSLI